MSGFFTGKQLSARKILLWTSIIVTSILLSYGGMAYRMDRQSMAHIEALDLGVAPRFLGAKRINKWGRLERRSTTVTCSGITGVAGARTDVDWSNSAICLANADAHANCIPVCDDPYSSCSGCDVLLADQTDQLTTAQDHCYGKANTVCPLDLKTDGSGHYDYPALSKCCLDSYPVSADSCMCDYQQYATPSCFKNGACLTTCSTIGPKTTCVGTNSFQPPAVCTGAGTVTCTGGGSPSQVALSCGMVGTTQYYLTAGKCKPACPSGTIGLASSGLGTCTSCGTGIATCSAPGVALTCAKVGSTQYYFNRVSNKCVIGSACPQGSGQIISGVATCVYCYADYIYTCTDNTSSGATSCGIDPSSGGQYALTQEHTCIAPGLGCARYCQFAHYTVGCYTQVNTDGTAVCTFCPNSNTVC